MIFSKITLHNKSVEKNKIEKINFLFSKEFSFYVRVFHYKFELIKSYRKIYFVLVISTYHFI